MTNIYLFVLFFIYPLLVRNGYQDIMTVKAYFYWWTTGIYIVLMLVLLICSGDGSRRAEWRRHQKHKTQVEQGWNRDHKGQEKNWKILDIGMLLFGAIAFISWLGASEHMDMFLGIHGRNMGLLTIVFSVVVFFLISRHTNPPGYFQRLWCVVGIIVSGLAVANHLEIDPLSMYTDVRQTEFFISTIGNQNVYAGYLGILLSVMMAKYLTEKKKSWFYVVFLFVGFMGMVASNSDSIFLVMAVVGFILFCWSRDAEKGVRFIEIVLIGLCAGASMVLLRFFRGVDSCWKLQGILKVVVRPIPLTVALVCVLMIYLLMRCVEKRKPTKILVVWQWIRRVGIALVILGIVAVVALMLYVNLCLQQKEAQETFGYLWRYLYLGEQWGNRRMKVWEAAVCVFGRMRWKEKILGFGPAGFYHAAHTYLSDRELAVFTWGKLLDAHNGFLQYLVSVGIVGVVSIYGSLIYAMIRFFKTSKKENNYVVYGIAVTAFLVQAIANNPHIFIDPFVIAIVAIGYGRIRKGERE